jgi:phosphatidylserine/phosphatidylglycerophosphate/cardiolipin synthase-like enzyme
MWNQSLGIDILADELREVVAADSKNSIAIELVKKSMPSLSDEDAIKVCQLARSFAQKYDEESVEIVATIPVSFLTKTRQTRPVMEELITGAESTIFLTGYAISDYFEEMLKLINEKSMRGVIVELFLNQYDNTRSVLTDIPHKNRRFLKIFEYAGKSDDKMAALHAKTILVDGKRMLISSANLSFHGLESNIEIGALITSKKKVSQVQEIFSDLKRQKIFTLIE